MTKFLYRNLQDQRTMIAYAVGLTVVGVGADILSAFPLKFILDKIVHHQDPNVPVFGWFMGVLDQFGTRNGSMAPRCTHSSVLFCFQARCCWSWA